MIGGIKIRSPTLIRPPMAATAANTAGPSIPFSWISTAEALPNYFEGALKLSMTKRKLARRPPAKGSKKLMGPARKIYDLEQPSTTGEAIQGRYFGESDPDNIEVPESDDGTWPVQETPWRGGSEANRPDKEDELVDIVVGGLTAHRPTDLLLLALAHGLSASQGAHLSRHQAELRIRAARSELAGLPKRKGPLPKEDLEQVCRAVAARFLELTLGRNPEAGEQSLAALLKTQLGLVDTKDTKPSNDKKIAPYERHWQQHKDRLLLRVSETHVFDKRRKAAFIQALKALRALGVEVDIDFIETNWDIL